MFSDHALRIAKLLLSLYGIFVYIASRLQHQPLVIMYAGIVNKRQIALALFDQYCHTRPKVDTAAEYARITKEVCKQIRMLHVP